MAFVSYSGIGEAVTALIRFHNASYGDRHIKITFSHAKERELCSSTLSYTVKPD